MNTVVGSTGGSTWFNELSKNDSPLVCCDGTTVSLLKHELKHLVESGAEGASRIAADDCRKIVECGAPMPGMTTEEKCRKLEGNTIGLAFSGGGIRSATFGLGVLEALKEMGLLKQFHFLSTVSGGGYLGGWLSANCLRAPLHPQETGGPARPGDWLSRESDWSGSIAYLRRYSKYLSPSFGFASADTWSMVTIWMRNALLVQFTIILAIAAVLLVPRLLMPAFEGWYGSGDWRWTSVALYVLAIVGIAANQRRLLAKADHALLDMRYWWKGLIASAVLFGAAWGWAQLTNFEPFTNQPISIGKTVVVSLLLLAATYFLLPAGVRVANGIGGLRKGAKRPERVNYTQFWVQLLVVLPLMVAALLVAAVLWGQALDNNNRLSTLTTFGALFTDAWQYWPLPLVIACVSFVLLSWSALHSLKRWLGWAVLVLAPSAAVVVLHALLCAIMLLVHSWVLDEGGAWKAFVWTPPLLLYAFSIAIVVLLGVLGRETSESVREWWSRLGAWLVIYGLAWLLLAVVAVYGPLVAAMLFSGETWHGTSISLGWALTTAAGLLTGNSARTSGAPVKGGVARAREWLTLIAPFVYIAGLLVAISTGLHLVIIANSAADVPLGASSLSDHHWDLLAQSPTATTCWIAVFILVPLALLLWRVDINEFSLNTFYRSRLVRCYLGATRIPSDRRPQNFTGFDESDDLPISDLRDSAGPLHIVNCALNLGGSSDLALHTRHSASFTITPLSTGSHYRSGDRPGEKSPIGFRETCCYGGEHGLISLGQAISVSGAAASPNMGYHSSPVVAFVLTMFNARLGWWFARPKGTEPVTSSSPSFSLRYLLAELFASADDRSNFVMVSDGGHFENLAVYELIRRRCRIIVASDAECDPEMRFEGLGTLKRMCEVDFGVTIDIDVRSLLPDAATGWSKSRCAVGRIVYDADNEDRNGIFIYLKASMNGHEDEGVLQYKAAHPAFPHESTGNQFYGEDQFESYRKLGKEIARSAFLPAVDVAESAGPSLVQPTEPAPDLAIAACRMLGIWSPALGAGALFARHGDQLMRIWHQLSSGKADPLLEEGVEKLFAERWPNASFETFRTAFYVSCQILRLMENVYMDLDLENTWEHPDNAGWKEQFTRWARLPAISRTWELTRHTFGKRFQYFWSRNVDPAEGRTRQD